MSNKIRPDFERRVIVRHDDHFIRQYYELRIAEVDNRNQKVWTPNFHDKDFWTEHALFSDSPNPGFELDATMAQELMDSLWQCGLRPTEGTGSAGSFAAQEKHLNDMRKLYFAAMEVEL